MSTALATINNELSTDQVDLIKRTIAKGATNDELQLFIATAKRLGLDPFARQIFAVKRGGTMTIQVSIDGLRLVADRTGKYAPGRATECEERDGKLFAATAYVRKLVGSDWIEVAETAHWDEYSQGNSMWSKMPRVMLSKCAESRALRRAFPAELSGVYSDDEMQQADTAPAAVVTAEIVVPGIEWEAMIDQCVTHSDLNGVAPTLATLKGADRDAARRRWTERKKEIDEEDEINAIANGGNG